MPSLNKKDIQQELFTILLRIHADGDAACLSVALLNGFSEKEAAVCDWVEGEIKKTNNCPDCPFVNMELSRKNLGS